MVSDSVALNPSEDSDKLAQGINFQLAEKVTGFPAEIKADGILGLRPVKASKDDPDVFMDQLFNQGRIKRNLFSLYFADAANKDSMASHVWFGGYSRRFISKFVKGAAFRTQDELDAMIRWVDIDHTQ